MSLVTWDALKGWARGLSLLGLGGKKRPGYSMQYQYEQQQLQWQQVTYTFVSQALAAAASAGASSFKVRGRTLEINAE